MIPKWPPWVHRGRSWQERSELCLANCITLIMWINNMRGTYNIHKSMKQIVWEKVSLEWLRCMKSCGMREHCMFLPVETLPLFCVSVLWECVFELCPVCLSLSTLCTVVKQWVVCIWHWRYSHAFIITRRRDCTEEGFGEGAYGVCEGAIA